MDTTQEAKLEMKAADLKEEVAKILNEAPESRRRLVENFNNLSEVADYCCHNYVQLGDDGSKALEETKSLTAQSLASIAYQINTLATSVLNLLDAQSQQLGHMESAINLIGQTVEMHREKVSRRDIGSFTAVRRVPRGPKISTPLVPPQPRPPYSRRPISYQELDGLGHGVKMTGKAGVEDGSIRKQGSFIRSSKATGQGLKSAVAPSGGSSTFGKAVAPPTIPCPPESDVITTPLKAAPPPPPDSSEVLMSPPPTPDSFEFPPAPPLPLESTGLLAPPPPPPPPPSETLPTTIVLPLTPPPCLETVLEESSLPPPSPPPPDLDHAFPPPSNEEPEVPVPLPTTQEVDGITHMYTGIFSDHGKATRYFLSCKTDFPSSCLLQLLACGRRRGGHTAAPRPFRVAEGPLGPRLPPTRTEPLSARPPFCPPAGAHSPASRLSGTSSAFRLFLA
ncbi:ABI gene family member 3-like isoform X1 [Syngnathus typhle]|uniref:ABI gene family member 3-like isoform X1 n=1 Tax=Syngnathus typhle TaxID=161592 RepID=UPI002A6A91D1|nr:ABI gene family member 3-like isoform X1 [Syngnathus typhle]